MQEQPEKRSRSIRDEFQTRNNPNKTYISTMDKKLESGGEETIKKEDQPDPKIIYAINFGEDAMIVVAKTGLLLYSLISLQVRYARSGFFWDAVFIPDTCCLAVVEHDGTIKSKRTLKIIDIAINQVISEVTITFQINLLKATKHCIALGGTGEVAVMHFPSLKPICHEVTGTGLHNIFDISHEGLTLAYQCQTRGMLIVHNFTQIITNQARRKSSMSGVSDNPKSSYSAVMKKKIEKTKQVVEINAHKENICLIKLSPNGSRVASASNKGTIIRIFLTSTGKLWEELRVGYELCKILDMNFYEQGNVLVCLTEKNIVQLYNVKLEPTQTKYQRQRRGYDIYEQKNPKSFFSFLSFFYHDLSFELPFAFKQLVKPAEQEKQDKQDKEGQKKKQQAQAYMPVVLEEQQQSKPAYIEQRQENNNRDETELKIQKNPSEINSVPDPSNGVKLKRSDSGTDSQGQFRRGSHFSTRLLKKTSVLNLTQKQLNFTPKFYNTVHRVFVGGNNFIWAVKGSYIFTLKYDPFNGGEMYHKETQVLH